MARRVKRSTKKDRVAEGRAVLASLPKFSATLLEFSQPLLEQLPQPPPYETLVAVMQIASVAWNLPIYERAKHADAAWFRETFDSAVARLPREVGELLLGLLYSRLVKYGHDPRTGVATVELGADGEARVIATAGLRDPPAEP